MAKKKKKEESPPVVEKVETGGGVGKKKKLIIGGVTGAIVFQMAAVLVVRAVNSGPESAEGAVATSQPVDAKLLTTEVSVAQIKAVNEKGREMCIYEVSASVRVSEENMERLNTLIERRRGAIDDAFNRVLRGADPQMMAEDTLDWLRTTLRRELERALDEPGLVEEFFIPRFMKYSGN
jgi:hypothetical protein